MRLFYRLWTMALGIGLGVYLCGCSQSLDTKAEQILEKDSSFAGAWEKKQMIRSEIASLQANFNQTKEEIEDKINQLKEELKGHEKEFKERALFLQAKLEPEQEDLLQGAQNLQNQLQQVQSHLREIEKEVFRIESEIKQKTSPSGADSEGLSYKEKLANQLSRLVVQREELKLQVKKLEDDVHLRKQEAHLLQSW